MMRFIRLLTAIGDEFLSTSLSNPEFVTEIFRNWTNYWLFFMSQNWLLSNKIGNFAKMNMCPFWVNPMVPHDTLEALFWLVKDIIRSKMSFLMKEPTFDR